MHLGAKQAHAVDIGFLPGHILGPHENLAFHVEQGASRRRGDAVLSGAGFGDDFGLTHAPGQQRLTHDVVDFMGAGMVQLVALEIELCAAEMRRQSAGEIERARPAYIVFVIPTQLGPEIRIGLGGAPGFLDIEDQRHQSFGDIATAENSEMSVLVGARAKRVQGSCRGHLGSWLKVSVD